MKSVKFTCLENYHVYGVFEYNNIYVYACMCTSSYHMYSTTEVVEHACSITTLQLGETLGGVSRDMDTYTYRTPLGVCAGITP